jgi:ribonuclease P protein component
VLSEAHRLTRGEDVRRVSRAGRRAGGDLLVVHLLGDGTEGVPTRFGFVVARSVGGSVVRHRVQRRLRHLCRERIDALPPGSQVVLRALAPAADATYAELGAELDRCLQQAQDRSPGRPRRRDQGTVS